MRTVVILLEGIHHWACSRAHLVVLCCSRAVFEAGGHKKLISQLCGGGPAIVANSAAALCNMAEQKVIRCSILSHGGIQALVVPLNSTSKQVLVNSLHCLAALACETKTRTQVGIVQYIGN